MTGPGKTAYPWERLTRVARTDARTAGRIRRAVSRALDPAALATSLAELLSSDVTIAVRHVAVASAARPKGSVVLETVTGSLCISLEPELPLVVAALARLLGRAVGVVDGTRALDEPLAGAAAALCVECARRAGSVVPLRAVTEDTAPRPPEPSLAAFVTVSLDGKPYDAVVSVSAAAAPDDRDAQRALSRISGIPLTLPVVGAIATAAGAEVRALAVGDVFLPGAGWLIDRAAVAARNAAALADVVLAAPDGERGVRAGRSEGGKFVLRPGIVALVQGASPEDDPEMSGPDDTLREIALEAPVVVRVEIATVTLSAGEWADLCTGDVIETGLRVGERVVLRVAGKEVARGDLVSLDGDLGVQIRELLNPAK